MGIQEEHMGDKTDVWQGTLALMVLKTTRDTGPPAWVRDCATHRTDERNQLSLNYGTLYPALLKLEQEGYVASDWACRRTTARRSFTG